MRISRLCYLMVVAMVAAMVIAPAVASAELLTNEYGQSFAGTAVCVDCHGSDYDVTSHGQFAKTGSATIEPNAASGMWPAGLAGKGESVTADEVTFSLGAGTGLREYIAWGKGTGTGVLFGVLTAEWDPSAPSIWEINGVDGVEFEAYACNQCHHLGATKVGVKPPISGAATGTANAWAKFASASATDPASYIPGSSIGCERCHGTGAAAASNNPDRHWNAGVKIVGYNTAETKSTAKAASQKILNSEVCGQCHGSFKSGGNIAGFTPDATITAFVPNLYTAADVPSEAQFLANPAAYKFFPNGENKGNKHSYYTEWAMSGHSVRGALTATSAGATPYQASGASHYTSTGSSRLLCNRCHTGEGYLKRKGITIMSNIVEDPAKQGMLGQECAACHISHGNVGADGTTADGEAVGMAVRAPETNLTAGYSVTAATGPNKSICEDCHNWQKEVQNVVAAPVAVGSKYASHPQRELYHGRALLEVPAGSDFMPGAKCEQCHMPATKSDFPEKTGLNRYADRSWKRYSHRMFIMLPGDAKAWGLAPWGDSCSPCHAGESQDELQANIDTWQTDATAMAAQATAAIDAAVARGVGSDDLVKRAWSNVSAFMQDGSTGAHNPPYIQAGLKKAVTLAKSAGGTLSVVAPASAGKNALFAVAGRALNGDGSAAVGATIKLFADGVEFGEATTGNNGNFGFMFAQTDDTHFTVKWIRSSQAASDLSQTAHVEFARAATTLTCVRSASSAYAGRTFYLRGSIAPAMSALVTVQYKSPGSSTWRTLATRTTTTAGAYSVSTRQTRRGTWYFRAVYAGNAEYLPKTSSTTSVLVR